jgi:hypothetical protein
MKVQGRITMQTNLSGVVVDIAAFKVSHSVGMDPDATTLRATRARSSSVGRDDTSQKGSKGKHSAPKMHILL